MSDKKSLKGEMSSKHLKQLEEKHSILRYQYRTHLQLFMHSDNYIQQRTYQFVTMNAIMFAAYAVFISSFFSPNPQTQSYIPDSILGWLMFLLTVIGLIVSYIWLRSYKRSCIYRDLHRNALILIEQTYIKSNDRNPRFDIPEQSITMGAFQLRDNIMYKDMRQPALVKDSLGFLERKANYTGLYALPWIAGILWVFTLSIPFSMLLEWLQLSFGRA